MNCSERARAVADAVLYEGFLLYPYTASAMKNQLRWQFGVVMPRGYADASEPSSLETHVLAAPHGDDARVDVTARFLRQREGFDTEERDVSLSAALQPGEYSMPFSADDLAGELELCVVGDGDYLHLNITLHNHSAAPPDTHRDAALCFAFVGAHMIVEATSAEFVSLLDPPDAAKEAASRCKNRRCFPVLIGDPDTTSSFASTALASPIILYDFPQIAPQSPAHTFDATEVDELLLLSVASLSDDEKREARATHARAREIVDRAEAMDAALQARLHGRIDVGARVRVHPKRNADAFDMFAEGMTARVQAIHDDVDGRRYVAVLFEGDPASDLHEWYGRSYFYESDEVEPLKDESP